VEEYFDCYVGDFSIDKYKRFCDEYILSLNATESAKLAGYSEKTAYSIGQRLLKDVEIQKNINEELESLQSDKIMDKLEILETYTGIVRDKKNSIKDILKALDSLSKFILLFKENEDKVVKAATVCWEDYIRENEGEYYKF
jgi:phage terminase small subunit